VKPPELSGEGRSSHARHAALGHGDIAQDS